MSAESPSLTVMRSQPQVFDEERQDLHDLVDAFVDACIAGDDAAMAGTRTGLRLVAKALRSRAYRRSHG